MALTRRQREVYDYVSGYIRSNGYAPSFAEIASALDLRSVATVHKHLVTLERKGLIKRSFNQSRSVELALQQSDDGARAIELPLVGTIAAGRPIAAVEESETLAVPEFLVGRGESFVLRVRGNSMIEEQIRDGDYVICERRDTARDGETVVALVDGEEATLKKVYRAAGDKVRLQPANPAIEPLVIDGARVAVQGVVLAVMRRYA
jgi:repressor LexA